MKIKKVLFTVMATALLVPSMAMAADTGGAAPNVKTPAADLRATLSGLLSAHFEYQALTTLKEYQGAPDAAVVKEKLEDNADEMAVAVKSLYGEAGAKQFAEIFSSQYDNSADLGTSVKSGNKAKEEQTKQMLLEDFPTKLGNFLSTATGGNLPAATAKQVLTAHEQDVQDFFYSYIKGDYEASYKSFDAGYKRMDTIGTALAGAIVKQMPEKFNNSAVVTPASDLRAALSGLLGLHFYYQQATTLTGYQGSADAKIAREMLEQNADEMTAAVKSLYGAAGAKQFADIFASQYDDSSNLGTSVKDADKAKEEMTKQMLLQDFPAKLGNFLSAATAGNLPADTAKAVLNAHEQDVMDVFYNMIKPDYTASYKAFDAGDKRMAVIGTALADAIVKQMPEKFGGKAAPAPTTPAPTPSNDMTTVWMKVNSKMLNINGQVSQMDTTPFVWSSWTFIPLRFLSEGIGANVAWDAKTDMVTVTAGSDVLKFWVGKDTMTVNGMKKDVGAKVMVKDGRTAIPLRFIAELLGWDVNFQKPDWSITLTKSMN